MSAPDIDRIAARQRNLRKIGAEIAGRLQHLQAEAVRVGLEMPAVEAFTAATAALAGRFGATPFVPKRREASDADAG